MKNKTIIISFLIYIFTFSFLGILLPDNKISNTERRTLSSFPEISFDNNYIKKVDKYFLDQFPFRDNFRSIKASFNYYFLGRLDNNGIYLNGKHIFKMNYPLDDYSIDNYIEVINSIKSKLNKENNIYLMIVPDKNFYINDRKYLTIDYDLLYKKLEKIEAKTIDIRGVLSLDDYYETDSHWREEKLEKVVKKMSEEMNFPYEEEKYQINTYDNFYGAYYSESALQRKPESLSYYTSRDILSSEVYYLENSKLNSVYNTDKLDSFDPYEIYLDGASAYIEITNNNSKNDKSLVIFRDSFASSLAPLLISSYHKIILIDPRYITSNNYLEYINSENQDILFIHSSLIINSSYALKR